MKKARASVLAALHLAPENRHIVRAAVRFFVHQEDWAAALAVAQRAYSLNPDPLIFGPLVSVGTRLGRLPKRMKPQVGDALASTDRFLFSEVLGAAGTLELINGADQRSRKFFREAWIDPTNSVISHSQWVLRERLPGLASEQHIDFKQSHEALGWLRHLLLDFRGSVFASNAWALDEPYSRGAYILGSSSACLTGDFLLAEQIAQAGHKANPREHVLMNNLGFAQLHNGRIQAAEETLRPLEHQLDDETQVAPAATFGMLRLAQKREAEGEALYSKAVQRALKAKNRPLALRATLNYVFSSISLLKKVDIGILEASGRALKDFGDAGCIGIAEVISRRLQNSDLQGTDDLTKAAKGFVHAAAVTRDNHLRAVNSRFHDILLLQAGPEEGGAASLSFEAPVPKKDVIKASDGAPTKGPMRLPRFDGHELSPKKGLNHDEEEGSRGNAPAV